MGLGFNSPLRVPDLPKKQSLQKIFSHSSPTPALSVRLLAIPGTVGLILGSLHPYVYAAYGDMYWNAPNHPPLARAPPFLRRTDLALQDNTPLRERTAARHQHAAAGLTGRDSLV